MEAAGPPNPLRAPEQLQGSGELNFAILRHLGELVGPKAH